MEQGLKFKALYSSLGYTAADVAKFLHVSPRSVHNWVSGSVMVPVMAVKLLRLHLRYELPGKDWEGWHLSAGRLYTPENHELNPKDFSWWSLLVRRAAMFDELYRRGAGVRAQGPAVPRQAERVARPGAAQATPLGEAGRAAQQPGLDLSNKHFRTVGTENPVFMRPSGQFGPELICHHVKKRSSPVPLVRLPRSQAAVVRSGSAGELRGQAAQREFEARVLSARPERRLVLVRRAVDYVLAQAALNAEIGSKRKPWRPSDPVVVSLWDQVLAERLAPPPAADASVPLTRQQRRHRDRLLAKTADAWDKATNGAGVLLVDGEEVTGDK